jgi:hypothetical protein
LRAEISDVEGANVPSVTTIGRVAPDYLRPVIYRGELVALAGPRRFHLIAPWLDARRPSDPELRFVALLCLYHQQVHRGELPETSDPDVAERWVRSLLEQGESAVSS